ncbi:lipase/acyltransferase domain-containing protein [Bradyrhizobium ivorense]|uniref:lipase/acyltransferase domain-containing protein n=1 Tax=Bradyrhizobium ivorense TaxID=2511166 RepID=UPI0010B8CA8A|nr:hypothetical protein [Bradyrhizobium ivorense]VIO79115.1 hypothetical protein CI41S_66830 [Bradyrhizobium ivorense]
MSFVRFIGACICMFAMCFAPSHGQVLSPKQTNSPLSPKISQAELDEFYAERRSARRKNTPRVVFVPGILGSKIDECKADGSQCNSIWGTFEAIRKRDVDLTVRRDRVYRTDVVDSILFKDIYGEVLEFIRSKAEAVVSDSRDDALVTVFHYDWRLSNGDNAARLKDSICVVRAHAESSPIIIIAHSMGGLLTKVWAARHANELCPSGKRPEVARIVFIATPHLGSPKAIKAVADGYNIMFDELTGLRQYLGYFERNYVLEAVNLAGISFPSLYELLPIRSSDYCSQQKPALAKAEIPVVGEENKPVNLFDVDVWRRYDLLRRIGAPAVRRSYYDNDLAPLLSNAEKLLCEIADFDPSTVAEVTYLFGREKADRTYRWFHLRSGKSDSIDNSTLMQGDGTVPVYSAQNFLVSSTWQTAEVQADHTSIVSSKALRERIDDLYRSATQRADIQPAHSNTQYASLLITEMAASGNLISVSLDPSAWTQGDDKLAVELNDKALELMGYQAADVAQFASTTLNAHERARLYAVAASSTKEPSQQLKWASELALASYEGGRFQDAIRNSAFVTTAAKALLPANDPQTASLTKTAREVEGWAYLRGGDLAKFNELASSYATTYAVSKDSFKEPASYANPTYGGSGLYVYTSPPYGSELDTSSSTDAWRFYRLPTKERRFK